MLDHFTRAYIATALWSSTDDDGEPLDRNRDADDIAPELLAQMQADCAAFYAAHKDAIHCNGAPLSREFDGPIAARNAAIAGHDFWLTRCGHGAGFWDGDWPEPFASELDKAANEFGNVDLYIGDDGQIWGA